MNRAAKDFLREHFRQWYASEVEKQFGINMDESTVNVDMEMAIVKEESAKWLTAL